MLVSGRCCAILFIKFSFQNRLITLDELQKRRERAQDVTLSGSNEKNDETESSRKRSPKIVGGKSTGHSHKTSEKLVSAQVNGKREDSSKNSKKGKRAESDGKPTEVVHAAKVISKKSNSQKSGPDEIDEERKHHKNAEDKEPKTALLEQHEITAKESGISKDISLEVNDVSREKQNESGMNLRNKSEGHDDSFKKVVIDDGKTEEKKITVEEPSLTTRHSGEKSPEGEISEKIVSENILFLKHFFYAK